MKAILPVAGWGTRLQPLTWSVPKYLLGVADKPLIQYAIDELAAAGVRDLVFVTSPHQEKVREYVTKYGGARSITFATQKVMRGNADAILKGQPLVRREKFIYVSFGDDVLVEGGRTVRAMVALSKKMKAPVLLLERVPKALVSRYGIVGVTPTKGSAGSRQRGIFEVQTLVEKPKLEDAPSNLSIIGRYVLTPELFKEIKKLCSDKANATIGGEFYLTDALLAYMKKGGRVFGVEFKGTRFDCGSKLGLMKANAYFGAHHEEFGKEMREYLKTLRAS
jgi:UTP--glucose-1-phosphate uridylyltransferase